MFPFLSEAIEMLIRSIMSRFIKDGIMKTANTYIKMTENDIDRDSTNFKKKVDIGFGATAALRSCNQSQMQVVSFHKEACLFLSKMTQKMIAVP